MKKTFFLSICIILGIMVSNFTIPASTPIKQHLITIPPNSHWGFFCCFLEALYALRYCPTDKTPIVHWNHHFLYYNKDGFNGKQSGWEYYFEPVADVAAIHNFSCDIPMTSADYSPEARIFCHAIIKKYIRLRTCVQQKIDQFYDHHMAEKYTIGIHIRGTDKYVEVVPVSLEKIIQEALKHANTDTQFLIATDEQRLLDQATHLLQPYTVIHYDCYRSPNEQPIHYTTQKHTADNNPQKPSPAQLGEDVLVEALLLSKCDLFIHTYSNVSLCVTYFNPDLKHILLQSDQMPLNLM